MNLSKKIFTAFFISAVALLCTSLYLIDTKAEQHEINRIVEDLNATQFQFQHVLDFEQKRIKKLTHIITSDQKFRSFLAQIKDNFYPFVEEIGEDTEADYVFMLDDKLSVRANYVANHQIPLALEKYLVEFDIQNSLDTGTLSAKFISLPESLYSSYVTPLKESLSDDYAIGLIVVVNQINDRWLTNLLAKSNAVQAVFFNNNWMGAKNTSASLAEAVIKNRAEIKSRGQFVWNNERYIAKEVPLAAPAEHSGYILCASLDQALITFKQLQHQVLLIGVGILSLGALLFLSIASRITKPLRLITKGTLEIKQGNFEHRIHYQNTDEVGQLASAFNTMATELQEKELIRSTFNKYVDPQIVHELLSQPDKLKLGGERKIQSVLFSDIAGFTRFSEKLPAEKLIKVLNDYLTAMTDEISQRHGILDKFIGDAIMVFWSPELCQSQHALYACETALNMQARLSVLRPFWQQGGAPEIIVRIGIATGEMIVGNIGSEQARSYTCIGDKVNYSSRLEGLNKYYGTHIIIDHETQAEITGMVIRELDTVKVKGRDSGETIYELIGRNAEVDGSRLQVLELYRNALDFYRQAKFAKALALFSTLTQDAPSQVMLARCQKLLQNCPEEWNGIYVMQDK